MKPAHEPKHIYSTHCDINNALILSPCTSNVSSEGTTRAFDFAQSSPSLLKRKTPVTIRAARWAQPPHVIPQQPQSQNGNRKVPQSRRQTEMARTKYRIALKAKSTVHFEFRTSSFTISTPQRS